MGMYTELVLSCKIKSNNDIINILSYMIGKSSDEPSVLPEHEFFKTARWNFMLTCSSYYFVPRHINLLEYDEIGKYWCFVTRSDFKNYSGEIHKFLNWLRPYLDYDYKEMIGYSRYEEDDTPVIYYSTDD